MSEFLLTQLEADALIAMDKHRVDETQHAFPSQGGSLRIPLVSVDKRENFFLDISRGRIDMTKGTYQNRARSSMVLVRLDFGGAPHRNPDNEEIPSPHLHLFREGFADKWAVALPVQEFPNIGNLWRTLEDFMRYCHVVRPPHIAPELF